MEIREDETIQFTHTPDYGSGEAHNTTLIVSDSELAVSQQRSVVVTNMIDLLISF